MRWHQVIGLVLAVVLASVATTGAAEPERRSREIVLGGGTLFSLTTSRFEDRLSEREDRTPGSVLSFDWEANYETGKQPGLDLHGVVWTGEGFGAGLAYSHLLREVTVSGRSISEFMFRDFFGRTFRERQEATLDDTALERSERAVHILLGYRLRLGARADVEALVGPSYFVVTQQMPLNFAGNCLAPDRCRLIVAEVDEQRRSAWGFHLGGGLALRVQRHLALSVLTRYAHAQTRLRGLRYQIQEDRFGMRTEVPTDAGGFQALASVRVVF